MSDETPDPAVPPPASMRQGDVVAGNAYGGDQVQGDAHTYQNTAPNQGVQGDVTVQQAPSFTINASNQATVTGNRQVMLAAGARYHEAFSDPLPAIDPVAAAALLAALPTDTVPDVTTLSPGSRMPFSPNPLFTGRDAVLMQVARALKAQRTTVVTAGIGGVGKTSLAVEVAHRYGSFFAGGVFWLNCADAVALPTEIVACGGVGGMRLPGFAALTIADQVARVQAAWQDDTPRLLVFDNCEDPSLLAQYRPRTGGCRALVTSRNPHWDEALGVQVQPLGVLTRADSMNLLRRFRPDLTDADADALADAMGDLPLGLHVTGSFLQTYARVTVAAYLAQLTQVALDHPAMTGQGMRYQPTGRELHVARAFALSYEQLRPDEAIDRLAQGLLARAARFAPGVPIPNTLLLATMPVDTDDLFAALLPDQALHRLIALGLIEEDAQDTTVRMHRLLCTYALSTAPHEHAQDAMERAIISFIQPTEIEAQPSAMPPLLLHLKHAVAGIAQRQDPSAAILTTAYGFYLYSLGAYRAALPFMEQATRLWQTLCGTRHPLTATSLNNLGEVYLTLSDYPNAIMHLRQALTIREDVYGDSHPDTASSLHNVAHAYAECGMYDGALPLYMRALTARQVELGDRHPDTASSLNSLGELHRIRGNHADAKLLLEQALAIREEILGKMHPDTATSLSNLALLSQGQDGYTEALALNKQALMIRETMLGLQHPRTAMSMNNIGVIYAKQGNYGAALALYERALAIWETAYDIDHPDVALALNNLAHIYGVQGDDAKALSTHERALTIRQQVFGETHLATAQSLNNLAVLYARVRTITQAIPLMARARAIRHRVLGATHNDTQQAQRSLENMQQRLIKQLPRKLRKALQHGDGFAFQAALCVLPEADQQRAKDIVMALHC